MTLAYAPATQQEIADRAKQHLRTLESAVFRGGRLFDTSDGLAAIIRVAPANGEAFSKFVMVEPVSSDARTALDAMITALDRRMNSASFVSRSDARRDVPKIAWRPGGVSNPSALAKARISVAVWSAKPLQAHAAAKSLEGQIEMLMAEGDFELETASRHQTSDAGTPDHERTPAGV